MTKLKVAAVQLSAGNLPSENLARAERLVRSAAGQGAQLIVLPENYLYRGPRERLLAVGHEATPVARERAAAWSRELGVWLVAGGLPVPTPRDGKLYNTLFAYNPAGNCVAQYRKVHLFDVEIPGVLTRRESDHYAAGDEAGTVDLAGFRTGLSVCYDLRFPELFRIHVARGAELALVPADFTFHTGEAHWELLLRARAVENQMFIIAPNQAGEAPGAGRSYGHSLIVGPWGEKLAAAAGEPEGVVVAELDFDYLRRVRRELPVLAHRRSLRWVRNRL